MAPQFRITLIYFIFGILWILLSDTAVELMFYSLKYVTIAQTFKGWFYVIITSAMLYVLIKRNIDHVAEKEREKKEIFVASIRSSQHILNNFLNAMINFHMDAEESDALNADALKDLEEAIFETKSKLAQLGDIAEVETTEIEKFLKK